MLGIVMGLTLVSSQLLNAYAVAGATEEIWAEYSWDFGFAQVTNLDDAAAIEMMGKLSFVTDPEIDKKFPAQRICRAEIITKDGRKLVSKEWEPQGEAKDNIGIDWLSAKFRRITSPLLTDEGIEKILTMVTGEENLPIRQIVDEINTDIYWKKR